MDEKTKRYVMLLLAICAAVPYINALFNLFAYDDLSQVLQNPYILDGSHLREIFTTGVWSFTSWQLNFYRPMMTFGYLVCHSLFGFAPFGYHLVSLLLHVSVVGLLFFVTRRIFSDRRTAFTTAAVFAFHPIHVEPVAYIAAVTELELTFFYLITFLLFLYLDRPTWWKYIAMCAAFVLTLLSKEQAVTLPVAASIYEHFYRADRLQTTWDTKVSRYLPFWLLTLIYLPWRAYCLGGFAPATVIKYADMTPYHVVLSALALVGRYLGKLFWPVQLRGMYDFEESTTVLDPSVMAGVLGILLAAALFCILWRRSRPLSFGLIWLFLTLAPALNVQWMVSTFAERYLYLPSVGFSWLIAVGSLHLFASVRQGRWRATFVAAAGVVAILCTFRIVSRNRDWYDNERETRSILRIDPDNALALNNLACILFNQSRPAEAAKIFLRVIEIQPMNTISHLYLGLDYIQLGRLDEAESELKAAVALEPDNGYLRRALSDFYERTGRSPPSPLIGSRMAAR